MSCSNYNDIGRGGGKVDQCPTSVPSTLRDSDFEPVALAGSGLKSVVATNLIAAYARIDWARGGFYALFCHKQGFGRTKREFQKRTASAHEAAIMLRKQEIFYMTSRSCQSL